MDKEIQQDANTDPTSSGGSQGDVNAAASSAAETSTDVGENDILSIAREAAGESPTPTEEGADGGVPKSNATPAEEPATDGGESEGEEAPKDEKSEEQASEPEEPPFHEHPRWKEIVSERNELKERAQSFETLAREQASIVRYCQENNVTVEQFQGMLEIAALLNNDPMKAYEKLKPIYETLTATSGDRLPDDLRQEVEDGLLSEERAKELARFRGQGNVWKAQQQTFAQRQQQAAQTAVQQGLSSWQDSKFKTDPDFRPKSNQTDPDGKYEMVCDKFRGMWLARPPQNPQEAVAMVEQAYDAVQKSLARFAPKPAPKRALQSNGASRNVNKQPASVDDIIDKVLSERE